ncbi:hypothetical protein EVAR_27120_1 [Eumeta japonica]|uniref:Uncharacterized protein n=1 Tax=Eumeta variegata TaxID=151549 RepID=A0A4C1W072_EUMVA|nr:hypothetical protein EVAR_27120_1 [Eumeta japonica]
MRAKPKRKVNRWHFSWSKTTRPAQESVARCRTTDPPVPFSSKGHIQKDYTTMSPPARVAVAYRNRISAPRRRSSRSKRWSILAIPDIQVTNVHYTVKLTSAFNRNTEGESAEPFSATGRSRDAHGCVTVAEVAGNLVYWTAALLKRLVELMTSVA